MSLRYLLVLVGLAAWLPSRQASAQVTAPSQGGEVSAVRVTATTMELKFGTTGTGQGRVVTIAAIPDGSPTPLAASNGQFYDGATTYGKGSPLGKGYVVYSGTGHSATITGLQPRTQYYVTNAEYNTDGSSIAYNTTGTSIARKTSQGTIAPLPVELTSFTGTVSARSLATLKWTTASERNTNYFSLERSSDGVTFTEVGHVPAATTSNQVRAYDYTDPQQLRATTYYRLRQVDLDSTTAYSSVVTLAPAAPANRSVDVYPNPSAGRTVQVMLQGFSGEALTLHLVDALGRPVFSQTLAPADARYLAPLVLPQSLSAGTYLLTLAGSSAPIQKRIVVSD